VVGSVLLLLAGYIGAYYATVTPSPGFIEVVFWNAPTVDFIPEYSCAKNGPWKRRAELAFAPIHQIDRHWIRPSTWKTKTASLPFTRDLGFPVGSPP